MSTATRPTVPALGPRLSAMMFLEFFIWGAWYVTVGNFLKGNGMMEAIPWAYSLCPIAAIISPFFLGMVADRFFATERVLAVMQLLGGLCLLLAPQVASAESQTAFIGVLLLHTLFFMPTLGLTNTLAFHHVTNPEKQFPIIRVCGTIGWIIANVIVSKVLHGDASAVQFYVAGTAAVLFGFYSFTLPHTPPPAAGKRATARDILGLDSLALLRNGSFAVFIICSFLICIPLAFYYSYAPVFVGSLVEDPAFNMSFGQMSEVFFMLVMPLCFARLGVKWMLAVGMLAWVARYGFFAAAADSHLMALVIAGIVLHGVCYDFFFVTGQIYVDKAANPKIRGQAQGFLVLVTQGIGMLIGAQVAGLLVKANTVGADIAWRSVWLIPCIAAGVIMLVFLALFRDVKQAAPAETPTEVTA
ncbi:MAG: nucleoside permease [Armatimonadetes bacterium]|nr:nucleoside permease [Armatimonadota bacterium]